MSSVALINLGKELPPIAVQCRAAYENWLSCLISLRTLTNDNMTGILYTHLKQFTTFGTIGPGGQLLVIYRDNEDRQDGPAVRLVDIPANNQIVVVPVAINDGEKSDRVRAFMRTNLGTRYDHANEPKVILLRNFEPMSDIWRGLTLYRVGFQASHAVTSRAAWDGGLCALHNYHLRLAEMLPLIAQKLAVRSALDGEVARPKYDDLVQSVISDLQRLPAADGRTNCRRILEAGYRPELDLIFGEALSDVEKTERMAMFAIDCVFSLIDKVFPFRDQERVKREVVSEIYGPPLLTNAS